MESAATPRVLVSVSAAVAIALIALAALLAGAAAPSGAVTSAEAATGAKVTLTAHRRKARRGGAVRVSGRINGAAAASAQQAGRVRIFVKRGRRWVISRRTTADANGAYRACARIRVARGVRTALLRAVTPAGPSRTIRVRVNRRAPGRCTGATRRSSGGGGVGATVLHDDGSAPNPSSRWGKIDCQTSSRHSQVGGGESAYRRLTVFDGDDVWGERCELGLNDHRYSPTALYREGQRRITQLTMRLPQSFPLGVNTWQAVVQMKQAQPSAGGGGTPVIELDAYANRWRLRQSDSAGPASDSHEVWSAPAQTGQWTRIQFDVRYSQHASNGQIQLSIDVNGDGDFGDDGEQSPTFQTYTLKREISGGSSDGIAPGQSIPSHLRTGIYHNPSIGCSSGCSVDVDDVRVLRP